MAIGSISPSTRTISAPEALRAAPETRRVPEQKAAPEVQLSQKLQQTKVTEERRTSREDKDNGSGATALYQAPSLKQTQAAASSKPPGTYVNVTA